ncbi:MAG: general secretion pathway protein [Synechococcaceae cyanobacterium SM2_3_2]|nr:general secretion pathway protein [Synechococcaceae cyanobacterium SM2_3_2]
MSNVSPIDRAKVPVLIAQFLPVEICVYYQVVPIAKEGNQLTLGMVDPEDSAALDYVGKMLAYSRLKIQPHRLTPQEQQSLIAYYFSHPPAAAEVEAFRETARQTVQAQPVATSPPPASGSPPPQPAQQQTTQQQATQQQATQQQTTQQTVSPPKAEPQNVLLPPPAPLQQTVQAQWDPSQAQSPSRQTITPSRLTTIPTRVTTNPARIPDEGSEETVQQLLNSMLRRALDENAEQILIDVYQNNTCRVRYRQQGILRDLFRQLSDTIRARLLANLKRMLGLDPELVGESQSAEVERTFRKEPLILQLKVTPQFEREGAVLSIFRGESLRRYQQTQHDQRVLEVMDSIQVAQESLQNLHALLQVTIDKAKQHPGIPTDEWFALQDHLAALRAQGQVIEMAQQDWQQILKEDPIVES